MRRRWSEPAPVCAREQVFVICEGFSFMLVVLSKALAFVLIILIGYICNAAAFFTTDYQVVSKIVLNITLPCAVINSFAHFEMDFSLIAAVFLGLFGNLMMLFVSLMLTRGDTPATKIFYIFSLAGYNVGCFTLPFAQAFLTPFAVVGLCMFDVGNSIMCTGMTYALTASCIGLCGRTQGQIQHEEYYGQAVAFGAVCCLYQYVGAVAGRIPLP